MLESFTERPKPLNVRVRESLPISSSTTNIPCRLKDTCGGPAQCIYHNLHANFADTVLGNIGQVLISSLPLSTDSFPDCVTDERTKNLPTFLCPRHCWLRSTVYSKVALGILAENSGCTSLMTGLTYILFSKTSPVLAREE